MTCNHCGGSGNVTTNPCPKCQGNGVARTEQEVELEIPKGAFQGMQLTVRGYGNAPKLMKGQFGDLVIDIFNSDEPEKYEREGNNLKTEIEVPVVDAILGCDVTVETISGKKLKAKIQSGTEDGHTLRFTGYGMPDYSTGRYGDLYGVVKLRMPKSITNDERKVLEDLKKKENFK